MSQKGRIQLEGKIVKITEDDKSVIFKFSREGAATQFTTALLQNNLLVPLLSIDFEANNGMNGDRKSAVENRA